MELFGIAFSIPAGLVFGQIYAAIVGWFVPRFRWLTTFFLISSWVVLAGLIAELVLLYFFGAARASGLMGSGFTILHLAVFVLGAPAIANVLVLPERKSRRRFQVFAGVAFAVFFTSLIVMQYAVSEALYGID